MHPSSNVPLATARLDALPCDFDALFAAQYAPLARLICRVVGDPACAEELAAEAFWKLHRNPPPSQHNLAGWLYRTGLNLALDNLKKRNRRTHYEGMAPAPGPVHTPQETLERFEQQARVRHVLSAIRPVHSSLLVLRSEGLTLAELAATLNLNPNSVGTFLARAELAFRKEYVNRYGQR